MKAIIKREFDSLFNTMTGTIFVSVLIAFVGIYFFAYNLSAGYPYFSYTLLSAMFILMLIVPLLTMRSFSEERKQKTDQILLTAPLKLHEIVLGKFFAMCLVLAIPCGVFVVCPAIISTLGTSYLATDYASLFLFFIIGCFFISVGMYISSLTESQVIAAVCSFGALLIIYLWGSLVDMLPTTAIGVTASLLVAVTVFAIIFWLSTKNWVVPLGIEAACVLVLLVINIVKLELLQGLFGNVLSGFVVTEIFQNFANYSLFDLGGLLKILIATAVMLFLSAQSIQKRRWS